MSLLSIYADTKHYRALSFDRKQCRKIFGDNIANQFDVNFEAKSYKDVWKPLDISFIASLEKPAENLVPEISEHNGRLYLNARAFQVLQPILAGDGEFLPVTREGEAAHLFNPLRIAEDVNGLDEKLSIKNEWGDLENIAFKEKNVLEFSVFRSRFDNYRSLYCHSRLKKVIENAGLHGVFFTPDLGNPYTIDGTSRFEQG